jgi:hypothetical protein
MLHSIFFLFLRTFRHSDYFYNVCSYFYIVLKIEEYLQNVLYCHGMTEYIQRITPIHSRSSTPDSINRITPVHSRPTTPEHELVPILETPPLEPPSPKIQEYKTYPWITHLKTCSELYGVRYKYASQCMEMRTLYYTKSYRDDEGRIKYPAKLHMIGIPLESQLLRKPWTGIAIRNVDGVSKDAIIV